MARLRHVIIQLLGLFALFALTVANRFTPFTSVDTHGGTKWALLVAGSTGYDNYGHQANICHAYQILKKGGLKDENIIVFMYDDIANNERNPDPGHIHNKPNGPDVYEGVPKDYIGSDVTVDNLLAVILGDKSKVSGGSEKVLSTGANDHIFVFASGYGDTAAFEMPNSETLYADDLIDTLKKKHYSGTYKEMAIYFDAPLSGSMFDGLLTQGMNIYVATSANPVESSDFTYWSDKYEVYLGTEFGVSWMEDSAQHDRKTRTLEEQYEAVKSRVSKSHVMQYGDVSTISKETLSTYMGAAESSKFSSINNFSGSIDEFDAEIYSLLQKATRAFTSRSNKKSEAAEQQLYEALKQRAYIDDAVKDIVNSLFGENNGSKMLTKLRPLGQPAVNDWNCFKESVGIYKKYCGLPTYAFKYSGAFANMCNAGVRIDQLTQAVAKACK